MKFCYECFKEIEDDADFCPCCGKRCSDNPSEPVHLWPGTILNGRYVIGHAIGEGGFAIVYKAFDIHLKRMVAIKEFFASTLMTRTSGNKNIIVYNAEKYRSEYEYRKKRVLAEARNMAMFISDNNIVSVFAYFEENNTAYIVMELLGYTLSQYMKQNGGSLEIKEAVNIAIETAKALKALHSKGIIHLDVAPNNIFISKNQDETRVVLSDFGAARLVDDESPVIDKIVKPGYSPEEQYGEAEYLTTKSDIYALGATLYHMLTGQKPEESTNRKIQDSIYPPHIMNTMISKDLSNAVMRAMAIESHIRLKDMDEFIDAVSGKKKFRSPEDEKRFRKIKRVIVAGAASMAVIAAGVYAYDLYQEMHEIELDPANIEVWYCAEQGSGEIDAMEDIKSIFNTEYPNIGINLICYDEEQYEDALLQATIENKLPALFESTGISETTINNAADLDSIIKSSEYKTISFLNDYDDSGYSLKQVPLAINVPVACVITNGPVSVKYDDDVFETLEDFGTDTKIAVSDSDKKMIEQSFSGYTFESEDDFMDSSEYSCPVLLTSTERVNDVNDAILKYDKKFVYCNRDGIYAEYVYNWSIGDGDKDQIKAAERLLTLMLSDYQSKLMLDYDNNGYIPINDTYFKEYCEGNANYNGLLKAYKNLKFKRMD